MEEGDGGGIRFKNTRFDKNALQGVRLKVCVSGYAFQGTGFMVYVSRYALHSTPLKTYASN